MFKAFIKISSPERQPVDSSVLFYLRFFRGSLILADPYKRHDPQKMSSLDCRIGCLRCPDPRWQLYGHPLLVDSGTGNRWRFVGLSDQFSKRRKVHVTESVKIEA